ncbi:MAG: hypothetical protein QGH07_17200, partial [Alphaproteobacteria bacterium]|nr:hypothetical protein [Alphaproteobacteria bacterium]
MRALGLELGRQLGRAAAAEQVRARVLGRRLRAARRLAEREQRDLSLLPREPRRSRTVVNYAEKTGLGPRTGEH